MDSAFQTVSFRHEWNRRKEIRDMQILYAPDLLFLYQAEHYSGRTYTQYVNLKHKMS